MYKVDTERLEDILDGGGYYSKVVKGAMETYLRTELEYQANIPQLTSFLVDLGILEIVEEVEERNVSRFNFTGSGS
jgi:hypothetical protein